MLSAMHPVLLTGYKYRFLKDINATRSGTVHFERGVAWRAMRLEIVTDDCTSRMRMSQN